MERSCKHNCGCRTASQPCVITDGLSAAEVGSLHDAPKAMVIGSSTEYACSFRDLEPIFLALVTDPKDWWLASNNCGQTALMVTVSLVFIGQKFKSQATQAVSSAGRKTSFNT